jgi:hypothetical protein
MACHRESEGRCVVTEPEYQTFTFDWNGIRIAVRYCQSWFDFYEEIYGYPLAHLEIESIEPDRTPLPMTETGYRSHFTRPDVIEAEGGPVPFVRAWLAEAAKDPEWIAAEADRKQMSLF